MQCQTIDVEDHLTRIFTEVDQAQSGRTYWEQNECLVLDRFIPKEIVNPCLTEIERLRKNVHRNYVPGHKQGGSVSYHAILNESHQLSAIITLYRSPALRRFLSHIVKEELLLCPEHDPHSDVTSDPVLTAEDEGDAVVAAPQQVLCEVEPRGREPARTRHALAVDEHRVAAGIADYTAEFPHRLPESISVRHRPVAERIVVRSEEP